MQETKQKEIRDWEERFINSFPLQYWATENYPGDSKDGELNFARWTAEATKMANYRATLVKSFISTLLAERDAEVREEYRKETMQNINDIIWNKDGSLKSHEISYIVSSVMHYFIK